MSREESKSTLGLLFYFIIITTLISVLMPFAETLVRLDVCIGRLCVITVFSYRWTQQGGDIIFFLVSFLF